MRVKIIIPGIAASMLFCAQLHAAIHCVGSSAELESAFLQAKNNGQSDVFKIKTGSYTGSDVNGFKFNNVDGQNVTISGGWLDLSNISCGLQNKDPLSTQFDGQGLKPNLRIDMEDSGDLYVHNLSFINGAISQGGDRGVGLRLDANGNYLGETLIDRVFFINNNTNLGAALITGFTDDLTVRNCVFDGNHSNSSTGNINILGPKSAFYFINNTVVNNTHSSGLNDPTGGMYVYVKQDTNLFIANNAFWNNEDLDLELLEIDGGNGTGVRQLFNNDIQSYVGDLDVIAGNINLDPQFGPGPMNYTHEWSSPLYNAGLPMPEPVPNPVFPQNWDHGTSDVLNAGRVQDGRVDIGAVEKAAEPPIFADGFD